eukprot:9490010-Pyramimonas_sp.AAC.1
MDPARSKTTAKDAFENLSRALSEKNISKMDSTNQVALKFLGNFADMADLAVRVQDTTVMGAPGGSVMEIPFSKFCIAPGVSFAVMSFEKISYIPHDAKANVVLEASVDEAKLEKFKRDILTLRGQLLAHMTSLAPALADAAGGDAPANPFELEIGLLDEVEARYKKLASTRMMSAILDLRQERAVLNDVEGKEDEVNAMIDQCKSDDTGALTTAVMTKLLSMAQSPSARDYYN